MDNKSFFVSGLVIACFSVIQVMRHRSLTGKGFEEKQAKSEEKNITQQLTSENNAEPAESINDTTDLTSGRDARLVRESNSSRQLNTQNPEERQQFIRKVLSSIVGESTMIETCFGEKRSLFCDWTGSAKALTFIEKYVHDTVLPLYANTHSLESRMGLQTSCFREEAREIIQLACNANRKKDVVLFVGNGSTAAIEKMCDVLGLRSDSDKSATCVVFVGPYEHTSNLVIWRETKAKVVNVPEKLDGSGGIDLGILSSLLDQHVDSPLKIGSFSAGSNVTGVLEDVNAVTVLLHKKGALAFWDYASAGPYVSIDMNPVSTAEDRAYLHKDAVFISTHKFIGGVGGTGILIAKRSLFNNPIPQTCGGGTVYFVDAQGHRFLSDVINREEGGTPNILGAIRAGLAFKVKQIVGHAAIAKRDASIMERALKMFESIKDHAVLLGPASKRSKDLTLPTFSFLIKRNGRYLHHNFVVALLSDLYGIQSRGGCLCAGPYVQNLLGMEIAEVAQLEEALVSSTHKREQYRPGVVRVSIPYFFDDERIEYVLNAIRDIALHGWRLLPLYRYENTAGEWGYRTLFQKFAQRVWLADFLQFEQDSNNDTLPSFEHQAKVALQTMLEPPQEAFRVEGSSTNNMEEEWLRWFVEPWEASAELRGVVVAQPSSIIVHPERSQRCIQLQHDIARSELSRDKSTTSSDGAYAIKPPMSKRDAKQPRRFGSSGQAGPSTKEQALIETVQRQETIVYQMSQAELFPQLPSKLMKLIVQASKEWSMINPGDRLLLGLSGGKDSLCLLHALIQIQKRAPFRFEIACCTIDPGAGDAFNPAPLIPYVESLGIKYHFEKTEIFNAAREALPNAASYCAFCARMKRGTLYRVARENGYTALVLAQHLDDFAESFFMSAIRNGCLRTMKANYVENKGEVRVIRPLCYVRERDTKEFSYAAKLPVINENCPACFTAPTERERVKRFLKDQETLVPTFFESVRKAILPLMDGNIYREFRNIEERLSSKKEENAATKNAKAFGQAKRQALKPTKESVESKDGDLYFE